MPQPNRNPDNARPAEENQPPAPVESNSHGMEHEPSTSLSQDIRAHTRRPHKGDVGRPETNEEVFQGSKIREIH